MNKFRQGDRVLAPDMEEPGIVVGYCGPGRILVVDHWGFRRRGPESLFEQVEQGTRGPLISPDMNHPASG